MKKYRYSENWNPLAHYTMSINQYGYPEMRALTSENGTPCIISGQPVMVPKVSLKLADYKDWFRTVYPNAKVETEVTWTDVKDVLEKRNTRGEVESVTPFTFTVCMFTLKLFANENSQEPISTGIGSTKVSYTDDSISLAEYQAWKRALTQLGFSTDIMVQDINAALPEYIVNVGKAGTLTAATEAAPSYTKEYKIASEELKGISVNKKESEEPATLVDTVATTEVEKNSKKTTKAKKVKEPVNERELTDVENTAANEKAAEEPVTLVDNSATTEVEKNGNKTTKAENREESANSDNTAANEKAEEEPVTLVDNTATNDALEKPNDVLNTVVQFKEGIIDRNATPIIGKTLKEIKAVDEAWIKYILLKENLFADETVAAAKQI